MASAKLAMVRVCWEFQQYTGGETSPFCNIHTNYAPNFHIHPNLLASNFFERRKEFLKRIQEVVATIETDDELLEYAEDEEISFMLHHFGIQKVIEEVNEIKKEEAKKNAQAQEKLENETPTLSVSAPKIPNQKQAPSFRKIKISYLEKLKKQPIPYIFWMLLNLQNEAKLENKLKCCWMLRIGAAIHHHRPKLFEVIKNNTAAGIQKKLRCIKKRDKTSDYVNVDKTQIIRICALLKSWTTNGVNGIIPVAFKYKEDGIKLMAQTFSIIMTANCVIIHILIT